MIHSKQHRGCRIQDPGTRGTHQTKTNNPWCTSRGCRVQNSGRRDPWLPVVKTSRLFAQRAHSAAPPNFPSGPALPDYTVPQALPCPRQTVVHSLCCSTPSAGAGGISKRGETKQNTGGTAKVRRRSQTCSLRVRSTFVHPTEDHRPPSPAAPEMHSRPAKRACRTRPVPAVSYLRIGMGRCRWVQ